MGAPLVIDGRGNCSRRNWSARRKRRESIPQKNAASFAGSKLATPLFGHSCTLRNVLYLLTVLQDALSLVSSSLWQYTVRGQPGAES
jgi:hypothetical protein